MTGMVELMPCPLFMIMSNQFGLRHFLSFLSCWKAACRLRTSLCLQFKPHHIAAGAIFLAAKFLKVKLPSDGEKVWWQEFDVTPRQLEEVSNQMLELYEQNRIPRSQGSEVEGNAVGGANHQSTGRTNEETVSANGYVQAGGASSMKAGTSMASSTRPVADHSYANNQGGPKRSSNNRNNDCRNTETRSTSSGHRADGEGKECWYPEQEQLPYENAGETSNRTRFGERLHEEDEERYTVRGEAMESGEWKNESPPYKMSSTGGRDLDYREAPIGQSPQDAIKMINKDKVKAALEKRRKLCSEVARKMDLMDDDDLIERELEDGIELAAENEKNKRDRRQSWSKLSSTFESEVQNYEDNNEFGQTKNPGIVEQSPLEPDSENVEEGGVSLFDDAGRGSRSPKLNRKMKTISPDKHLLDGQRYNHASGYHHNHHDGVDAGDRIGQHGYADRDNKRRAQENLV